MKTSPPENLIVCVLVTRRADILVVRNSSGQCELPLENVLKCENPLSVVESIAEKITKSALASVGSPVSFFAEGLPAVCYPILTKRSSFENWATSDCNLVWVSKADCQNGVIECGSVLAALVQNFPNDAGNDYAIGETSNGIPTFFHLSTGETLHGQVGPWQEAQHLYIPLSRLEHRSGRVVVHDLGLGCATLALAALDAFLRNQKLVEMEILSFDLENKGVEMLLQNIEKFSFASPFRLFLEEFFSKGETEITTPDGRKARWRFCKGDFVETSGIELSEKHKANVVFLDFFSPKSAPSLWAYRVVKNIFSNSATNAIVITSSGATSTRAVLAAAGFFVGLAPASGKRSHSTVAAKQLADLNSPLPQKWLQTFRLSHVPFCDAEDDCSKKIIKQNLEVHPQFLDNTLPTPNIPFQSQK
jgi:tRNA U34 5-methylaminomethyl-2-thiouridine-forming methyltransferase MnmC